MTEVIIVLVIMGIIAVITIPVLLRNHIETANRTKVKKAISEFEQVVENMRITHGLTSVGEINSTDTSTLVAYANNDGNCTNARTYFKIAKESEGDNSSLCKFKTTDGIWWDITAINKAIIAIDNKGQATYLSEDYANKQLSDADGKKSVLFYSEI